MSPHGDYDHMGEAINLDNNFKVEKVIFTCACIFVSILLIIAFKFVLSFWVYAVSIGYSIISLSSIKKNKQLISDKYSSLITLNVIAIIISSIALIVTAVLMIG